MAAGEHRDLVTWRSACDQGYLSCNADDVTLVGPDHDVLDRGRLESFGFNLTLPEASYGLDDNSALRGPLPIIKWHRWGRNSPSDGPRSLGRGRSLEHQP